MEMYLGVLSFLCLYNLAVFVALLCFSLMCSNEMELIEIRTYINTAAVLIWQSCYKCNLIYAILLFGVTALLTRHQTRLQAIHN